MAELKPMLSHRSAVISGTTPIDMVGESRGIQTSKWGLNEGPPADW